MSIKQTIVKTAVVATTFALVVPSFAGAVTIAELQAQINALLAQLSLLQGSSGGRPAECPAGLVITPVAQGASGPVVLCAQALLKAKGHLSVTPTGFFGPLTFAAVKAYQSVNGLTMVGNIGPLTSAKLNSELAGAVTPTPTPTPTPLPSGPLQGGAGDITVSGLSTYASQNVGEGSNDVKVASFEVEADSGSDVAISNMKLELRQQTTAESRDLDDYMRNVSLWLENVKVGSASASDFSDAATTNTWVKSVSTSNAVIKAGEKKRFYIAVSANNSIDSGDYYNDDWHVGVSSIRFIDGQGVTTTESVTLDVTDNSVDDTVEQQFSFGTSLVSNAVELKLALKDSDTTINKAHLINAKAGASDNDDVPVLSFTLEAKGSDLNVQEFPVVISTSGETDEAVMLKAIHLYRGSTKLGSESVPTGGAVTFDNLDFTLTKGTKDSFQIRVDAQDLTGALDEGDGIKAEISSGVADSGIIVRDSTSERLTSSEISGSALGEESIFRDIGFNLTLVSTSAVVTHSGDIANSSDHDIGTFKITFDVTAWDGDVYVDKTNPDADGGLTEADLNFTGSPTLTSSSIVCDTGCTGSNGHKVSEGETERLTITGILTPTADGLHDMSLTDLIWTTTDADGDTTFTYDLGAYKTPQLFLNMDAS